MLDLMIHPIDTLNRLLGMPVTVAGTGRVGPSGAIDYAFVTLDYQNASGMVEGSAMMPDSFPIHHRSAGPLRAWRDRGVDPPRC